MSVVLTDTRLGEIAIALLLEKYVEVPSELLPEALKGLEVELVSRGVCTEEEAVAVTKKILAVHFGRQYPPEVLAHIKEMRAREAANMHSH